MSSWRSRRKGETPVIAALNNSPTEYVAYEFIIRDKNYPLQNTEPQKCSELVWVEMQDLPEDVVGHFRHVIERSIIGGKPHLELGY